MLLLAAKAKAVVLGLREGGPQHSPRARLSVLAPHRPNQPVTTCTSCAAQMSLLIRPEPHPEFCPHSRLVTLGLRSSRTGPDTSPLAPSDKGPCK